MATKKYNFPPEIIEQIKSGFTDNSTIFDPITEGDYIKLSVYGEAGLFIESFQSNIDLVDGNKFNYVTDAADTLAGTYNEDDLVSAQDEIDYSCSGFYRQIGSTDYDEAWPSSNNLCGANLGNIAIQMLNPQGDPVNQSDSAEPYRLGCATGNYPPSVYLSAWDLVEDPADSGDFYWQVTPEYSGMTGEQACDTLDIPPAYNIHADIISTDQFCAEQHTTLDVYTYSTTTATTGNPLAVYIPGVGWETYYEGGDYVTSLECYRLVGTQLGAEFRLPDGIIPELEIFREGTDPPNFYAKPNDALDRNSQLFSEGNYTLQFDFLRDYQWNGSDTFYINEISPSRKEIRLYLKDPSYEIIPFVTDVQDDFIGQLGDPDISLPFECSGDPDYSSDCQAADDACGVDEDGDGFLDSICIATNPYYYNWTVQLTKGKSIPIVNYQFDTISDSDNISLIVRLNAPIPIDLRVNDDIKISKEMFDTQTEEITYLEGETPGDIVSGDGLGHQDFGGFEAVDTENDVQDDYQTYHELSASVADSGIFNQIVSSSYDNLNIDYNSFETHTFFGSAVSKIENFSSKANDIEDYLLQVSESLVGTGSFGGKHAARRRDLFSKIRTIKDGFTPYERFLYYDNQTQTTASAPGIGQNLAFTKPLSTSLKQRNFDGFETVYKLTSADTSSDGKMGITLGKYRAEQAPFYNYSGSVYLSFLLRADSAVTASAGTLGIDWGNTNVNIRPQNIDDREYGYIPKTAFGSGSILSGSINSSSYSRFIVVASQSYWKPTGSAVLNGVGDTALVSFSDTNLYEIYSTHEQIQSASNIPTGSGLGYPVITNNTYYENIATVITASGKPFSGSFLPSGELFNLYWPSVGNTSITSSYFTDIKITTKNPLSTPVFSHVYSTGSSEWTTWYDYIYEQAGDYDERNLNSLFKNLPQFIQLSEQSNDLKRFVNMLGEHYDVIRNHIDNYLNFYKINYKNYDTVPKNLFPILAENFGWQLVTPFSASMSDYYANVTDDLTDERSREKIIESTWKKILNNLVFIYKSKGTLAAVQALLNVYGYPGDSLNIQELGGSTQPHNPEIFTDNISKLQSGLFNLSDNISFKKFREPMYFYRFNGDKDRVLKSSWGFDSVTSPETIEFILRPDYIIDANSQDKTILKSSGSGTQNLWDIRLTQSSSNANYGKLEFRLNNTYTGSGNIVSNALSMSTEYLPLQQGGTNWNIMLQRMSSSISASGTQGYKLFVALQKDDKITEFSSVSMSISGGLSNTYVTGGADSNYYANQNWASTGSLSSAGSSNLYIGLTYTGSISEFRVWSDTLQIPKFKQHVLNKRSSVGNSITSSRLGIYYHYKMNENWATSSTSPKIIDSNKNNVKDYSIDLNTSLLGSSNSLYVHDTIDIYKFSVRVGGHDQANENKITIDPQTTVVNNLSHEVSSVRRLDDELENKRIHSDKLQIIRSPQRVINEFIIDNLSDYDISGYFSAPSDLYSGSYGRLDSFRDDLFDHFDLKLNINKWMRANSEIFNKSNIDAITSVLPERASKNIGLLFEPSLLERNKIKHHKMSIGHGVDIGNIDTEIDIKEQHNFEPISTVFSGEFVAYPEDIKSKPDLPPDDGKIKISTEDVGIPSFFVVKSKNLNISVDDNIDTGLSLLLAKDSELNPMPSITQDLLLVKDLEINPVPDVTQNLLTTENSEIFLTKDTKIQMGFGMSPPPVLAPIDNIVLDKTSLDKFGKIKTKKSLINLSKSELYLVKEAAISSTTNITQSLLTTENSEIFLTKDTKIQMGFKMSQPPVLANINLVESIITSSISKVYEGTVGEIAAIGTASFSDLYLDSWGTGSDSVHFQNQGSPTGEPGSSNFNINRWQNKFPYESRYIFKTIGDFEIISSSKSSEQSPDTQADYNNIRYFLSREIRDKNKGYVYESFVNVGGNIRGPQNGRAIGKTSYYVTKSNGNFHYPSNHWINFSEDISRVNFINGTQNIGGDYFQSRKWIDYSTASAYTVQIAEEGHIEVIKAPQRIDASGKPRRI